MPVTLTQQWVRRPQNVWLRRALFQIHLWTGLAVGLYIVAISLSGSALVFRDRIFKALGDKPTIVAVTGRRLTQQELRAAAEKAYPQYTVSNIFRARRPEHAVMIWLERKGKYKQRLFDPYTGKDTGPSEPPILTALTWLADLHFNLLAGEQGRMVNGYLALLWTLMCLTGAVLWWPGIENWRRSLAPRTRGNWKRLNWELHSTVGFWTYAFSLMWGITGVYVVFPSPFQRVVALYFIPDLLNPQRSPDERILRWMNFLHFGEFFTGDWALKAIWVVVGIAPAFLFVTGAVMWWNRVLRPSARRSRQQAAQAAADIPP
ncbi:MAG: hypothetical protein C5B51_27710 [Terriglobia bacterium]|nr:MAG: hypothetical protein C5B51_27710 [Terriglobia bacterium]